MVIHLPGVGDVPVIPDEFGVRPELLFVPVVKDDFDKICSRQAGAEPGIKLEI